MASAVQRTDETAASVASESSSLLETAVVMSSDVALPAGPDPRDAYFSTDHLTRDLKRRTVHSGAITLSAQAAKFALRLGSTAILARLLTPADFGLIAMVTVVTGFVEMFKDAGLSMATIQRERITHSQVSTLFWVNVALSACIMLIIAALAPAIAWFYDDPRLVNITLALAGTMIFGGLTVQHQALLRRKMQFGRLAMIEIASMVAGIATAVVMAWFGFTYWALVGMTGATAATTAAMSFAMSGWIPGLPDRNLRDVVGLLKFGGHVTGFTFCNYFSRNADNFLIGKFYGADALGAYGRAYSILLLPLAQINAPIGAVAVPALSRVVQSSPRYLEAWRQFTQVIWVLTAPIIAVALVFADLLVPLLLGPGWDEVVRLFQVLGVAGIFQPVAYTAGWLFISQGRTAEYLRWGVWSSVATVLSFVAGLPWGPMGVAVAYAATRPLSVVALNLYVGKSGPVRCRHLMLELLYSVLCTLLICAALLAVRKATSGYETFVVAGAAITTVSVITLAVAVQSSAGAYLLSLVKRRNTQ